MSGPYRENAYEGKTFADELLKTTKANESRMLAETARAFYSKCVPRIKEKLRQAAKKAQFTEVLNKDDLAEVVGTSFGDEVFRAWLKKEGFDYSVRPDGCHLYWGEN